MNGHAWLLLEPTTPIQWCARCGALVVGAEWMAPDPSLPKRGDAKTLDEEPPCRRQR